MDWHSDEDLDRLDAALMALPEDNDPMLLTEFDGFCAGLVTCPELIPPSVWLKHVWGLGGPPEFRDLSEMQAVLDLVMAHYNRVVEMLMVSGVYSPVLDEDQRNGDILWEFWMTGFSAAMRLRPAAWDAIRHSGDARAIKALKQMDELAQVADRLSHGKPNKSAKLVAQAPDLIPELVEDLNAFTKSRDNGGIQPGFPLAANLASTPAGSARVGRNDPCPCGSGKKFKKCHDAGASTLH